MRIGVPREVKDGEYRVALSPIGVGHLVGDGHEVLLERGAGAQVGFADGAYEAAGARLAEKPGAIWSCDLIVKVKELQSTEYGRPRRGQMVFGFQQFGPDPKLLDAALASGATFIAYETVGQNDASLPIVAPMSALAGRLAVQVGAWTLHKQNGGSGVLLSGIEGVPPGRVTILGAGNVGANALAVAHGMGAEVTVFARSERRFAPLRERYRERLTLRAGVEGLAEALTDSDLVIGAVLSPGRMSPKLITRAMLARMRAGSVLVDVGIDQGGIAETSRATTHSNPVYVEEGVLHYCVPNMPSACARTASLALERAVLPYARTLARHGLRGALEERTELASGVQVSAGFLTHEYLARDTRRACTPLAKVLA